MRTAATRARLLAGCVATCAAAWLLLGSALGAADVPIRLIGHPTRAMTLTKTDVRAIYLKRRRLWNDGEPIIPINREAGSAARELFSEKVFGQDSRRLAAYWNQRYFEAGEFPPATLASEEAVVRFVSENRNAVGYVTAGQLSASVVVLLVVE
jgi:ABC-type phosphate transport system substrate-binding protein